MNRPPNILYLHSHDTGRSIEPMGFPVATPNLMKLASQGLLMRQCFCANPTCSPSRAALITGRYPHTNGMTGLVNRGFCIGEPQRALPNLLKQAGYRTAMGGTQHVIPQPRVKEIGYDQEFKGIPDPDRPNDHFATLAGGAVEWIKTAGDQQPFFLSVGFNKPQWYDGPRKDVRYVAPLPGLPDTPETREHTARLHAGIEAEDRAMGLVLDALEATGLADNTLVVCTTDHGLAIPRYKCNLTDGGLGVMSIWRGPGGFTGGRVTDALVSHVDFFPTLCDVAGIEKPDGLQGVSLLPLAKDENAAVNDYIFGEVNYHATYEPQRCVRDARFKYIKRYDHRNRRAMANCDPSPSKDLYVANGWGEEIIAEEVMYDTLLDPHERVNLLDASGRAIRDMHAADTQRLKDRLARWMDETQDPMRSGFIEPQVGGQMNDPNAPGNRSFTWTRVAE